MSMGPQVSQTASAPHYAQINGIAKWAKDNNDFFVVANELVSTRLGQALCLPVAACCLVSYNGKPCYVSLDFNVHGKHGEILPPCDTSALARDLPNMVSGTAAFDAWILNTDRHQGNLSYDTTAKRLMLFDHGRALYREVADHTNFDYHIGRLGFTSSCLVPVVTSIAALSEWLNRIDKVPEYYILDTISEAVEFGLPRADQRFVADYLLERRSNLRRYFRNEHSLFPAMNPQLFDQL